MILITNLQILYIVFVIVSLIVIILLYTIPQITTKKYRKKFKKKYYKVIDKLVIDKDYLLINNFIINSYNMHIDHIIFAKKFIYLIKDSYFEGAVEGKLKDNKWIYYQYKKHGISTIDNPFISLKKDLDSLIHLTGLDRSLFYMIDVINDDTLINLEPINKQNKAMIISMGSLINTIEEVEKTTKYNDINQEELLNAAKAIARINERDVKKWKKK